MCPSAADFAGMQGVGGFIASSMQTCFKYQKPDNNLSLPSVISNIQQQGKVARVG
jgi:hypothetical protein